MHSSKILITPRSVTKNGHPLLQKLTTAGFNLVFSSPGVQPDEEELIQLLPGCIGYLAGVEKFPRPFWSRPMYLKRSAATVQG